MRYVAPIRLVVQPSSRLLLIQRMAHLLAASGVVLAALPGWLTGLLLLLTAVSYVTVRAMLADQAGVLILRGNGKMRFIGPDPQKVGADETAWECDLHPHSTVWPFLVILLYRRPHQRRFRSQLVLADSMAHDEFRQLRLWLRWRADVRLNGAGATPFPALEEASPGSRD